MKISTRLVIQMHVFLFVVVLTMLYADSELLADYSESFLDRLTSFFTKFAYLFMVPFKTPEYAVKIQSLNSMKRLLANSSIMDVISQYCAKKIYEQESKLKGWYNGYLQKPLTEISDLTLSQFSQVNLNLFKACSMGGCHQANFTLDGKQIQFFIPASRFSGYRPYYTSSPSEDFPGKPARKRVVDVESKRAQNRFAHRAKTCSEQVAIKQGAKWKFKSDALPNIFYHLYPIYREPEFGTDCAVIFRDIRHLNSVLLSYQKVRVEYNKSTDMTTITNEKPMLYQEGGSAWLRDCKGYNYSYSDFSKLVVEGKYPLAVGDGLVFADTGVSPEAVRNISQQFSHCLNDLDMPPVPYSNADYQFGYYCGAFSLLISLGLSAYYEETAKNFLYERAFFKPATIDDESDEEDRYVPGDVVLLP